MAAHGDIELQKEKIITKALCRVLAGFNFPEVKDAVDTILGNSDAKKSDAVNHNLWNSNLSYLL